MHQEFYNLGLEKIRQGDLAGAIKEFSRALKVNPEFVDAYYKRAITHFDSGDFKAAVEDYDRVLQIDPDNINAYCGRGIARLALGNMQDALEDGNQSIRINSNHAPAYSLRGTACQRIGNIPAAIANFKKAAELYLEQKNVAKCRQCIENIKKLQLQSLTAEFNPEEFINEALKKALTGQYNSAIEDLNWLIELNPREERAYYNRGLIYAQIGGNRQAIEDFNQTIRLNLNYAEAYYHRGMARADIEDYKGAIADLERAAKMFGLQGNSVNYQQSLSEIKKVEKLQKERARNRYIISRDANRGRPNFGLQQRLMILVGGDWDTVWRLVELEREKNPGMPENWYWEKAIYNTERDRGIK